MKRTALLVAAVLMLAGCTESEVRTDTAICGHGDMMGTVCACWDGYQTDVNGKCTIPPDSATGCGDHGKLVNGVCSCDIGYKVGTSGKCEPGSQASDCGDHGKLVNGACVCDSGYQAGASGKCEPAGGGSCTATFEYVNKWTSKASGGESDWDVYLIGSMNEWKEADPVYKMTSDGNGKHTITFDVTNWGDFTYKFYINGWADNSYHSDPSKAVDADGNNQANGTCGARYTYCEDGDCSGSGEITPPVVIDSLLQSVSVSGKSITIKLKDGLQVSGVTGGSGSAKIDGTTITDTVSENTKYTYFVSTNEGEVYVPVWVEEQKFDWHDALLYFAFTDRFLNSDGQYKKSGTWENSSAADWYGGDFKGLQQKVEEGYFDELGVNTLWISSVTKNTEATSEGTNGDTHNYSAYHSYWPVSAFMTDYNKDDFNGLPAIEDHFGTMEDLHDLVEACHKKGIRVLVDFAANHVFKDSPMVSKHPEWFNDLNNKQLCDDNGNWDNYSEKCWFSQDLPDINYENAEARKTMVDHAVWLIKQTNIDGFRVDAVKHMNIQFIKELRAATESLFANTGTTFYMVGETFTYDVGLLNKYIGNDLLHAQFDFPLYGKLGNVLRGEGLYTAIHDGQTGVKAGYKSDLMGTFMGNHDVARAISVAAGQNEGKWGYNDTPTDWTPYDRLMAAWMILLTQPGIPLIYYGDEFGMPGSNDPDNRRMMLFGDDLNEQQKSTLSFVQSVGKIRRNHKALSRGEREMVKEDNATFCYKMNYNGETVLVGIGLPDNYGNGPSGCDLGSTLSLVNLFTGEETAKSALDLTGEKFQLYLVK
ncbi:MAG: hypothetical protein IJ165_07455 [Proteobacteria bacterium]|nr:hypothetical protein [Pseudomonadota bacterium]